MKSQATTKKKTTKNTVVAKKEEWMMTLEDEASPEREEQRQRVNRRQQLSPVVVYDDEKLKPHSDEKKFFAFLVHATTHGLFSALDAHPTTSSCKKGEEEAEIVREEEEGKKGHHAMRVSTAPAGQSRGGKGSGITPRRPLPPGLSSQGGMQHHMRVRPGTTTTAPNSYSSVHYYDQQRYGDHEISHPQQIPPTMLGGAPARIGSDIQSLRKIQSVAQEIKVLEQYGLLLGKKKKRNTVEDDHHNETHDIKKKEEETAVNERKEAVDLENVDTLEEDGIFRAQHIQDLAEKCARLSQADTWFQLLQDGKDMARATEANLSNPPQNGDVLDDEGGKNMKKKLKRDEKQEWIARLVKKLATTESPSKLLSLPSSSSPKSTMEAAVQPVQSSSVSQQGLTSSSFGSTALLLLENKNDGKKSNVISHLHPVYKNNTTATRVRDESKKISNNTPPQLLPSPTESIEWNSAATRRLMHSVEELASSYPVGEKEKSTSVPPRPRTGHYSTQLLQKMKLTTLATSSTDLSPRQQMLRKAMLTKNVAEVEENELFRPFLLSRQRQVASASVAAIRRSQRLTSAQSNGRGEGMKEGGSRSNTKIRDQPTSSACQRPSTAMIASGTNTLPSSNGYLISTEQLYDHTQEEEKAARALLQKLKKRRKEKKIMMKKMKKEKLVAQRKGEEGHMDTESDENDTSDISSPSSSALSLFIDDEDDDDDKRSLLPEVQERELQLASMLQKGFILRSIHDKIVKDRLTELSMAFGKEMQKVSKRYEQLMLLAQKEMGDEKKFSSSSLKLKSRRSHGAVELGDQRNDFWREKFEEQKNVKKGEGEEVKRIEPPKVDDRELKSSQQQSFHPRPPTVPKKKEAMTTLAAPWDPIPIIQKQQQGTTTDQKENCFKQQSPTIASTTAKRTFSSVASAKMKLAAVRKKSSSKLKRGSDDENDGSPFSLTDPFALDDGGGLVKQTTMLQLSPPTAPIGSKTEEKKKQTRRKSSTRKKSNAATTSSAGNVEVVGEKKSTEDDEQSEGEEGAPFSESNENITSSTGKSKKWKLLSATATQGHHHRQTWQEKQKEMQERELEKKKEEALHSRREELHLKKNTVQQQVAWLTSLIRYRRKAMLRGRAPSFMMPSSDSNSNLMVLNLSGVTSPMSSSTAADFFSDDSATPKLGAGSNTSPSQKKHKKASVTAKQELEKQRRLQKQKQSEAILQEFRQYLASVKEQVDVRHSLRMKTTQFLSTEKSEFETYKRKIKPRRGSILDEAVPQIAEEENEKESSSNSAVGGDTRRTSISLSLSASQFAFNSFFNDLAAVYHPPTLRMGIGNVLNAKVQLRSHVGKCKTLATQLKVIRGALQSLKERSTHQQSAAQKDGGVSPQSPGLSPTTTSSSMFLTLPADCLRLTPAPAVSPLAGHQQSKETSTSVSPFSKSIFFKIPEDCYDVLVEYRYIIPPEGMGLGEGVDKETDPEKHNQNVKAALKLKGTAKEAHRMQMLRKSLMGRRESSSGQDTGKEGANKLTFRDVGLQTTIEEELTIYKHTRAQALLRKERSIFQAVYNCRIAMVNISHFFESLEVELTCPRCFNIYLTPQIISPCGESACKRCLSATDDSGTEGYQFPCGCSAHDGSIWNELLDIVVQSWKSESISTQVAELDYALHHLLVVVMECCDTKKEESVFGIGGGLGAVSGDELRTAKLRIAQSHVYTSAIRR